MLMVMRWYPNVRTLRLDEIIHGNMPLKRPALSPAENRNRRWENFQVEKSFDPLEKVNRAIQAAELDATPVLTAA